MSISWVDWGDKGGGEERCGSSGWVGEGMDLR